MVYTSTAVRPAPPLTSASSVRLMKPVVCSSPRTKAPRTSLSAVAWRMTASTPNRLAAASSVRMAAKSSGPA